AAAPGSREPGAPGLREGGAARCRGRLHASAASPLKRFGLALALAAAFFVACGVWGFWLEPRALVVRTTTIPLAGWPREDNDLRVALLGDLHTGSPFNGLDKLRTIVERTNAARPNLVLLLGDYLSGAPGGQRLTPEAIGSVLGGLRAPLGVY